MFLAHTLHLIIVIEVITPGLIYHSKS